MPTKGQQPGGIDEMLYMYCPLLPLKGAGAIIMSIYKG